MRDVDGEGEKVRNVDGEEMGEGRRAARCCIKEVSTFIKDSFPLK